jgi:hypothetical protein
MPPHKRFALRFFETTPTLNGWKKKATLGILPEKTREGFNGILRVCSTAIFAETRAPVRDR